MGMEKSMPQAKVTVMLSGSDFKNLEALAAALAFQSLKPIFVSGDVERDRPVLERAIASLDPNDRLAYGKELARLLREQ